MNQIEKKEITKALMQLALSDSKEISIRFAELIAYLQKQEHLAALGTMQGLEEKLRFVEVVLKVASRLNQN